VICAGIPAVYNPLEERGKRGLSRLPEGNNHRPGFAENPFLFPRAEKQKHDGSGKIKA